MSSSHYRKFVSVSLIDAAQTHVVARNVNVAASFIDRLTGLLRYRSLDEDSGIWLLPCKSVHTIGMDFVIDVVFLDKTLVVRKIASNLRPGRVCLAPRSTHSVLELAGGRAASTGLGVGNRLLVS